MGWGRGDGLGHGDGLGPWRCTGAMEAGWDTETGVGASTGAGRLGHLHPWRRVLVLDTCTSGTRTPSRHGLPAVVHAGGAQGHKEDTHSSCNHSSFIEGARATVVWRSRGHWLRRRPLLGSGQQRRLRVPRRRRVLPYRRLRLSTAGQREVLLYRRRGRLPSRSGWWRRRRLLLRSLLRRDRAMLAGHPVLTGSCGSAPPSPLL